MLDGGRAEFDVAAARPCAPDAVRSRSAPRRRDAPARARFARGGARSRATCGCAPARAARESCTARASSSTSGSTKSRADLALLTTELAHRALSVRRHPVVLDARSAATASSRRCRCCGSIPRSRAACSRSSAQHQATDDSAFADAAARQDPARDAARRDGGARRSAVRALLRRRRRDAAVRDARGRLRGAHRRRRVRRRAVAVAAGRDGVDRRRGRLRTATASSTTARGAAHRARQPGLEGQRRFDVPRRRPHGRRADRARRGAGLRVRGEACDGRSSRHGAATTRWQQRWLDRGAGAAQRGRAPLLDATIATTTASRSTAQASCAACDASNAGHLLYAGLPLGRARGGA